MWPMKLSGLLVWCVLASSGFAAVAREAGPDLAADKRAVETIFAVHDQVYEHAAAPGPSLDAYLAHVADDVILMPDDAPALEGKAAYRKVIEDSLPQGRLVLRHELVAIYPFTDVVVARGRATGSFTAPGETTAHPFETKNVFIFRRGPSGQLIVWQIIFNHSPVADGR